MRICLHERVLNGFIGFGGIAQIVPGNPRGAPLLAGDDLREQLARRMIVASRGGILNLFNMFSGGALSRFSVLALGIMPYLSPSHIMQLISYVLH